MAKLKIYGALTPGFCHNSPNQCLFPDLPNLETPMDMTLSQINEAVVAKAAARCREKGIIIPTLAQMKDPALIPADIQAKLDRGRACGTSIR